MRSKENVLEDEEMKKQRELKKHAQAPKKRAAELR